MPSLCLAAAGKVVDRRMTLLQTLTRVETASQEIKKSRFLCFAGPVSGEAEARDFIAAHHDRLANHNCWAWRVGQNYRFSDDGEPSGTAGKPMLQAIDGQGLDRVAVIVIRWFGGILLGSGGLMRAYGGTAALCLRDAEKSPLIDKTEAQLTCLFADLALIQARLAALPQVEIVGQEFTDTGARLTLSVHDSALEAAAELVADLTGGRSRLDWAT